MDQYNNLKSKIFFICLVTLFGCNHLRKHFEDFNKSDSITKKSDTESSKLDFERKILDTIYHLPEVLQRANYVDSVTKGKRVIKAIIFEKPSGPKEDYYWIKVGEENEITFVSNFNFFVYPKGLVIKYFDTVKDSIITLDKWRQTNKNGG